MADRSIHQNFLTLLTLLFVGLMVQIVAGQEKESPSQDVLHLIPAPKTVVRHSGELSLDKTTRIWAQDKQLIPLAKVVAKNIFMQTGFELAVGLSSEPGDGINLSLDPKLDSETYTLSIDHSVDIAGKDYRSVVWGTSTLLQLLNSRDQKHSLPKINMVDSPDYKFRSVMLDLARRWHPLDTVKQTVDLLSLYKINYLHLHLSDNQSCVYTSRVLPKLATEKAYSWEEMRDLVEYADQRGVTIIPEIDVPGHCSSWVTRMPELFGTTDPKTGKSRPIGIVNMANEEAYEALDRLVEELSQVFESSPYIHMGTDETGAGGLIQLPEYQPYCQTHGLTEAAKGNAHELFLHFIERMNRIVRKHGKQAIAWNDFGGARTPNVKIPTNVTTMFWVGNAESMANLGYPIINCCRLPLYMVPPQQSAPEDHRIYSWNAHTFMNWHIKDPVVLPEFVPIRGAQICFWEQRYNEVIPILRPRVPAFAERLWHEGAERTITDLRRRRLHTDSVVGNIITPVRFDVKGLLDDRAIDFDKQLIVSAKSRIPGTIRYKIEKAWEHFPDSNSEMYSNPIQLNQTATVSARLYDKKGKPVGGVTQQRFRKMIPAYQYRMLGPTPNQGWPSMPDFKNLKVQRSGVMGLMDKDRGAQINRAMFAGLNPDGHIDVRIHGVYNPFTLELKSQMKFPLDGIYTFKLKSRHGLADIRSGDKTIVASQVPGREYIVQGNIKAGNYPLTIKYFYRITQNELNVWVKAPGARQFAPLESLVVPKANWIAPEQLNSLPPDSRFADPLKLANTNLATDKPVKASSWQENWVPANTVDGIPDNSSGWHAAPYPQWLQVDLKRDYAVNRIKLFPYFDGGRSYQYIIEVSQDGKNWKQIVDMTKNVKPAEKSGDEHNFETVRVRYVKVRMLNNTANPGVHINELMVFEDKRKSD